MGQPFSLQGFRMRAMLLGLDHVLRLKRAEGVVEWSGLGTWIFLRCYCHVQSTGGIVRRKEVGCFD